MKKYELSNCLIFRDSADDLPEWLSFHIASGYQHFYLYNNESIDNWREKIEPYLNAGYVTAIDYPGLGRQQEAYNDCLKRFGPETKWLSFIDDDEFLYTQEGTVTELLSDFEDYAGLAAHWLQFGSSGHLNKQEKDTVVSYTKREAAVNPHVKCIIRPDRIERSEVVAHKFIPKEPWTVVNERKEEVNTALHRPSYAEKIRINHYIVKSREEMVKRRSREDVDTGKVRDRSIEEWIRLDDLLWNQIEDKSASRIRSRSLSIRAQIEGTETR